MWLPLVIESHSSSRPKLNVLRFRQPGLQPWVQFTVPRLAARAFICPTKVLAASVVPLNMELCEQTHLLACSPPSRGIGRFARPPLAFPISGGVPLQTARELHLLLDVHAKLSRSLPVIFRLLSSWSLQCYSRLLAVPPFFHTPRDCSYPFCSGVLSVLVME